MIGNNFPWPEGVSPQNTQKPASRDTEHTECANTEDGTDVPCVPCAAGGGFSVFCDKISSTAQGILDARARDPDASLADLYDPLTMPPDLFGRPAHGAGRRGRRPLPPFGPDTRCACSTDGPARDVPHAGPSGGAGMSCV